MTNLRDIAVRMRPVNRVAANAVSGGEAYVPSKKIVQLCSETPIPTTHLPADAPNPVGEKCGQLVVVGYAAKSYQPVGKNSRAAWVCRCSCGRYTLRSAKAIRNPKNSIDCCELCRHVEYLKRHDTYRQTGRNATQEPT